MPVLTIHIERDQYDKNRISGLLTKCSDFYAKVTESPIDRVRVFVNLYDQDCIAVGGKLSSQGGESAPFFECLALQGRPLEQRHKLLSGFTDLIESELGVDRSVIRGCCWTVPPEDWCIAGTPASMVRAKEIAQRQQQQQ